MHTLSIAARVLRQHAPTLPHAERRACITVADHLDGAAERPHLAGTLVEAIQMDCAERTERAHENR